MVFLENINMIGDFSTRINQDIKFIDMTNWKVFEYYIINGQSKMNLLGFFDSKYQYHEVVETRFLERRSNFHGYHMKAMTEEIGKGIRCTFLAGPCCVGL